MVVASKTTETKPADKISRTSSPKILKNLVQVHFAELEKQRNTVEYKVQAFNRSRFYF